eukprot:g32733.t1
MEDEMLFLQFSGGIIVALEEAQDGRVIQGVGGGVEVVRDWEVLSFVTNRAGLQVAKCSQVKTFKKEVLRGNFGIGYNLKGNLELAIPVALLLWGEVMEESSDPYVIVGNLNTGAATQRGLRPPKR